MVDMSPGAVTTRLRDLSRQLEARGFVEKGVDMSVAAVTGRLRALAALSEMCLRLVSVGRELSREAKEPRRD